MTDDLINRQAAIDVVHHTIYEFFDVVEDDDESPITYNDMKLLELNKSISTRIKDLPSTQLEQKRGKWIKMSDADGIYWACSECGEDIPRVPHFDPQFDLFPRLESIEKTNFCPNCGAKMEVDDDSLH